MRILGIETSCDDTSVAIYSEKDGLLVNKINSQTELHNRYGGVVPELASRDHARFAIQLVQEALDEAKLKASDIDGIAYTAGPGLLGSLMVGSALGASLGVAWGVPAIGIHHMEGHLLAPMLEEPAPQFPFLALLVSGGHTQIIAVQDFGQYKLLGESIDDAAGEAFDKTAKLLGLPYPGGPELAKLALKGQPNRFRFPRPMTDRPGLDFSFSGLKTAARNAISKEADDAQTKADIAFAFQEAVVDTLCIKIKRALEASNLNRLVVAGGVSANLCLRERLKALGAEMRLDVHYPRIELCTDNAAMIALAGYYRLKRGETSSSEIRCRARWPLNEL